MIKTYLFTDRLGAHAIWSLIDSITAKLIADGNKVIYCRFDDNNQGVARAVPDGVITYDVKVPTKKYIWDLYRQHKVFSKKLTTIIASHDVDLVHTNFAIPAISARFVAKKCGAAVVSTQHELYDSMSLHLRFGLRWTEKFCDHIVYISQTVAKSFAADKLKTNKDSIILNGIDVDRIAMHTKAFDERYLNRIICAGRMVPVKGQYFLLDAMSTIIKAQPNTELLFVGSGPDEQRLKDRCKQLGLEQHVTFLGWLSREKTMDAIASSSVIAIPSDGTQEGFGLVVAEALALQVPIICSDIPVFKEVAGDVANYFPVSNVECLANVIITSLEHSEMQKVKAENGLKRVRCLFDQRDMVKAYLSLYDILLNRVH